MYYIILLNRYKHTEEVVLRWKSHGQLQWRSQPDNLVPLCKFEIIIIIHFFRNWLFSQSIITKICIAGLNRRAGYATGQLSSGLLVTLSCHAVMKYEWNLIGWAVMVGDFVLVVDFTIVSFFDMRILHSLRPPIHHIRAPTANVQCYLNQSQHRFIIDVYICHKSVC